MATPRKSTSSTPSTPRRPCTPESNIGRSPRAPGPPSSPDRRYLASPDKPAKSYLRPTVSSSLHQGNNSAPRKSIDRPPFLPPSSVGVASIHHKNPNSSKGSLSLKSILTKANNALKVGRKSTGAGSTSGTRTPVRPRSPALVKKEATKSYARSNSVPKKMEVVSTRHEIEETETVSIHSIEDHGHEQLADQVESAPPRAPEITVKPTPPRVDDIRESVCDEKIEDAVNEDVGESSIVVIEEKHEEIVKVEEIEKSSTENVKVIEECREEQPKVEEEVEEKHEEVVIVEAQEEVPKVEQDIEIVKDMNQENENNVIVEEDIQEPEIITVVETEEEIKAEELKEDLEEREIEITQRRADEDENKDKVDEETPETKVETVITEETPKEEEKPSIETEAKIEHIVVEETPKVEEKPTTSEIVEKKEDAVIAEAPKVEKKTVKIAEKIKPRAVGTKKEGAISNDVIEETRTKLLEKRKSKVGALVGAFETVMQ